MLPISPIGWSTWFHQEVTAVNCKDCRIPKMGKTGYSSNCGFLHVKLGAKAPSPWACISGSIWCLVPSPEGLYGGIVDFRPARNFRILPCFVTKKTMVWFQAIEGPYTYEQSLNMVQRRKQSAYSGGPSAVLGALVESFSKIVNCIVGMLLIAPLTWERKTAIALSALNLVRTIYLRLCGYKGIMEWTSGRMELCWGRLS